jgi:curved DNA-binding protein CbpA
MRRFSDTNYYAVLGVLSTASRDEIRTAYRVLVRSAHPDTGGDPDQFALIAEAWEVLGNENQRAHYDADRKLAARAARRYTARIDRDPETGSWSTQTKDKFASADDPPPAPAEPDDGLTPGQRWKQNKRRL